MPPQVFAQDVKQDGKAGAQKFSQAQLDQILAPIALYPDSLLAQIFIASTYPLEVVVADRWANQNKNLKGDELNNALGKQPWDASVKALVPFPDVLSMMSQKLDWTQMVGDAFLAQQGDVMDTVQKLRKRASDAGNLKSTEQQKVIAEQGIIRIEPANPSMVYVPVYDPLWIYGPWWWPYYPPYAVYPYPPGVVFAPGFIWFGVGLFVGAYWGSWGYWGWHNHACYVNPYYFTAVMAGPSAQPSQAVVAAPAAGPSAGLPAGDLRRKPGRMTLPIGEGSPIGTRPPGSGSASRQTVQPWKAGGISADTKATGSNGGPGPAARAAHPPRRADPMPLPAGRADPTARQAGREEPRAGLMSPRPSRLRVARPRAAQCNAPRAGKADRARYSMVSAAAARSASRAIGAGKV